MVVKKAKKTTIKTTNKFDKSRNSNGDEYNITYVTFAIATKTVREPRNTEWLVGLLVERSDVRKSFGILTLYS